MIGNPGGRSPASLWRAGGQRDLFYSNGCDGILELQVTNLGAEKNTYLKESKDIAELILHFPKIYDLQESKSA